MKRTLLGIGVFLLLVGIVLLAFTFVDLPHATTEPYQVPKSSDIINESFAVHYLGTSVNRSRSLIKGDSMHIQLEVTTEYSYSDIDFYVRDETTIYIETRVTSLEKDWRVPSNGTYYFVYDNNLGGRKWVNTTVTRHWIETNYRDVTKYYPLFSYEFSYVSLILSFAGIGIVIWSFIRKETPKPKS